MKNSLKYSIFSSAFLLLFLILGSYLASYIFYMRIGLDENTAGLFSWYGYYKSYDNVRIISLIESSLIYAYGGLAGVIALISIMMLLPKKKGLHGDASFAKPFEIRKYGFLKNKIDNKALLIGKLGNKFLMVDSSAAPHAAIAAPTGSGKGVGIVIPNLLHWEESIGVLDIKRENWKKTAGWRCSQGHKCYIFDPLPSAETKVIIEDGKEKEVLSLNKLGNKRYLSHRYNPFDYIQVGEDGLINESTVSDLKTIAEILIPSGKDPFWATQGRALFVCIAYLIFETKEYPINLKSVYDIAQIDVTPLDLRDDPDDEINYLYHLQQKAEEKGSPFSNELQKMVSGFAGMPEATRGSVYSTLQAALSIWSDPLVCLATEKSDFDLRKIREEKMSIYVCSTPNRIDQLKPLLNLFFQQMISLNTEKELDKIRKYRVLMLMDEFTSIGKMNIFLSGIAYVRSYGLRFMPIYQNNDQLNSAYTKDGANTFRSNIGVKVNYAPNTLEEAKLLSEELGNRTVKSRSIGNSKSGRSTNVSEIGKPLMSAAEILEMGGERLIVTSEGNKPIFANKIFWFKDKYFNGRANLPTPPVPNLGNLLNRASQEEIEQVTVNSKPKIETEVEAEKEAEKIEPFIDSTDEITSEEIDAIVADNQDLTDVSFDVFFEDEEEEEGDNENLEEEEQEEPKNEYDKLLDLI